VIDISTYLAQYKQRMVWIMVVNTTLCDSSVISWRSGLLVE